MKQTLRQKFKNVFLGKPKSKDAYKDILEDQRRSQVYPYRFEYNIIEPTWDYVVLDKWGTYNPVLRTVHEAIIKEVTRNRGSVKPRWFSKCPKCNAEFQTEKTTCPTCGGPTVKPDINQKQLLDAFVEDPNPTDELLDIQKSCYRYMLRLSDWYVSIQRADSAELSLILKALKVKAPIMVYVEDATKMRVCADEHGNLGNNEWFCPKCVGKHPEDVYQEDGTCKQCGNTELKETAYVQVDGAVKARWAKDEMLHGKLDANLPSLYGLSREISILTTLKTLDAMDGFNFDNYSEGKLGNILVFEGLNQEDVNNLAQKAKEQQNKPERNPNTGMWFVKKLKTLFLGSGGKGGVTNIPAMPESEKMQSLDWWKLWRETVCSAYGVQDVTAGALQEGTTGQNPRMKIDINNNTTEDYQHAWSDPFNNVIVLQALGVTDWVYDFNPVEEKDEAQDTAILQAKLNAIQTAISLGFDAELTDEQEVKISGKPLSSEEKFQRQQKIMQAQKPEDTGFEGKEPFKKENVFATEKGKKWIVEEVKDEK